MHKVYIRLISMQNHARTVGKINKRTSSDVHLLKLQVRTHGAIMRTQKITCSLVHTSSCTKYKQFQLITIMRNHAGTVGKIKNITTAIFTRSNFKNAHMVRQHKLTKYKQFQHA